MRRKTILIFKTIKDQKKVHFLNHQLSGLNKKKWYPINDNKNLFSQIEDILIKNNYAFNLTRLEKTKTVSKKCEEYEIEYNAR